MRRHAALQPLSRDHHDALLHARRLRGEDARIGVAAAAQRFLRYHDAVLVHHFREEEEALLPHLPADLADRLVAEHNDLRRRAATLANGGDAKELGEALRSHVRFEEDVVFQHLQAALSDDDWMHLRQRAQDLRQAARPRAGEGEDCFLG
jgi:hypothetical protein